MSIAPHGQNRACWGSKGTTLWRQLLPTREGNWQGRHVPARLWVYHESSQPASLQHPLSLKERKELAPYTEELGILADGSSIPFDDVIELTGRTK